MIAGLGVVDLAMLGVVAVSVLVGLVRGLIFEVMSLAGWVAAYFAAHWFAADVAAVLPVGTPGSGLNRALAFAFVFIATLVLWSLLARLLRMLLHATPLSLIDRAGGAVFGVVRSFVLLLVLATLVRYTAAAQSPLWQASVGARWLAQAIEQIQPLLPGDAAAWLPRFPERSPAPFSAPPPAPPPAQPGT